VNLLEWLNENNDKWIKSNLYVTEWEAKNAYHLALESMAHLNRNTASLMKKYKCHGGTDITGFGLLGHAQNLASA